MATIIILNAPPRAGKDTIAKEISDQYGLPVVSFKTPMFNIARGILGEADFKDFMAVYESDRKDTQELSILGGMNCRQFMIWISECVIKPQFGKKHFGWLMADLLSEMGGDTDLTICSDGGFPEEVEALIDFGHKVKLVRMHRKGFDFSNDSRDYIYLSDEYKEKPGTEEIDIELRHGFPQDAADLIATLFVRNHQPGDVIPW